MNGSNKKPQEPQKICFIIQCSLFFDFFSIKWVFITITYWLTLNVRDQKLEIFSLHMCVFSRFDWKFGCHVCLIYIFHSVSWKINERSFNHDTSEKHRYLCVSNFFQFLSFHCTISYIFNYFLNKVILKSICKLRSSRMNQWDLCRIPGK